MKKALALSALLVLSVAAFAQQKAGIISLPQLKVTMSSLNGTGYTNQPIIMNYLPGSAQFTPNVNLMTQDYDDSLESYKKLTDEQLSGIGISPSLSKVENGAYSLEYEYNNDEVMLHILTVAKAREGKVYLVTASATVDQWKANKAELTRVANSLEFTK